MMTDLRAWSLAVAFGWVVASAAAPARAEPASTWNTVGAIETSAANAERGSEAKGDFARAVPLIDEELGGLASTARAGDVEGEPNQRLGDVDSIDRSGVGDAVD